MPSAIPPATRRQRRLRTAAAALAVVRLGVALFDWNLLRRPIEHIVSERLERRFRIAGPLSVRPWSLHPSVSADGSTSAPPR